MNYNQTTNQRFNCGLISRQTLNHGKSKACLEINLNLLEHRTEPTIYCKYILEQYLNVDNLVLASPCHPPLPAVFFKAHPDIQSICANFPSRRPSPRILSYRLRKEGARYNLLKLLSRAFPVLRNNIHSC